MGGFNCNRCVQTPGCDSFMSVPGRCETGGLTNAWGVTEEQKGLDCMDTAGFNIAMAFDCRVDDPAWLGGRATGACAVAIQVGRGATAVGAKCTAVGCKYQLGRAAAICDNLVCADDGTDATVTAFITTVAGGETREREMRTRMPPLHTACARFAVRSHRTLLDSRARAPQPSPSTVRLPVSRRPHAS